MSEILVQGSVGDSALGQRARRVGWLLVFSLAAATLTFLLPPIPQRQAFHRHVDQRAWWGIPCAADVLSNLPFLAAGLAGLAWLARERAAPRQPASGWRAGGACGRPCAWESC